MEIQNLLYHERPREKASLYGIRTLSNEELLAILIRTGYKGNSAIQIAQKLLELYPLERLPHLELFDLIQIKGIKNVKALELLTSFELARRVAEKRIHQNDIIDNQYVLLEWIKKEIGYADQEQFLAIYLNTKNHIISYKNLFIGTLDTSIVHPREIFKWAVYFSAAKIICVHNHPSGDCTPSLQDKKLTSILIEAGEVMGIPIIDHLIVGGDRHYSIFHD